MNFDFKVLMLEDWWGALIAATVLIAVTWLVAAVKFIPRVVREAAQMGTHAALASHMPNLTAMNEKLSAALEAATKANTAAEKLRIKLEGDVRTNQWRTVAHTAVGALVGLAFGLANTWVEDAGSILDVEWPPRSAWGRAATVILGGVTTAVLFVLFIEKVIIERWVRGKT